MKISLYTRLLCRIFLSSSILPVLFKKQICLRLWFIVLSIYSIVRTSRCICQCVEDYWESKGKPRHSPETAMWVHISVYKLANNIFWWLSLYFSSGKRYRIKEYYKNTTFWREVLELEILGMLNLGLLVQSALQQHLEPWLACTYCVRRSITSKGKEKHLNKYFF